MSDNQSPGLPVISRQALPVETGSILDPDDLAALAAAVEALEHNNLATRLASALGQQIGSLTRMLPPEIANVVNQAADKAISGALIAAMSTLDGQPRRHSRLAHQAFVALTGAAGGFFGLASLPIELPISTVAMLRAIAAIALEQGEDLSDPDVAIACLQVFALGAHDQDTEFTESGYFAVRALLAQAVSEAGRYALERGISDAAAPVLLRLVSQVSTRFGVVVSQKLVAQSVPILGAAGGAAVNYAFAAHFQSIATGHFTIRRLERTYGQAYVRMEYDRLRAIVRPVS